MASENHMAEAFERFKCENAAVQCRIVNCLIEELGKVPERKRPAEKNAPFPDDIDVRLDMFTQAYWGMHYWPLQGWGIPETPEPVTTLRALSDILPGLLENDAVRLQGVLPPKPRESLDQYLEELLEAVLEKAEGDSTPDSLPSDWVALLRLTDVIYSVDLLKQQIPEISCTGDIDDCIPETLAEIQDFALSFDGAWDITAGFVMGLDEGGYCHYIYCSNADEDASEGEKEWEWRVAFGGEDGNGGSREYVGDLAGFLKFYAGLSAGCSMEEIIRLRIQKLEQFNSSGADKLE
ncbi:hypothetical protein G7054_g7956 [Neopestalotiopsis clavispora]|nr:hypothetical protein G7054_g7956 [Neopestalotiopsis clavispora]